MKIAVLMGGVSGEREVSLQSGIQVVDALRTAGHEALALDTSHGLLGPGEEEGLRHAGIRDPGGSSLDTDLLLTGDTGLLTGDPRISDADLVFPALHGGRGEDGTIQTLLEMAGIPYVGSGRVGCALAMDKDLSKRLFRDAGVATPRWILALSPHQATALAGEVEEELGLPLIVKPPAGGSTLGLSLVHHAGELPGAVALALKYEDQVLFEGYVKGREVTVGILGNEALPVGEIIPEHELFDYECKYRPGMAREIFPASLPEDVARQIQAAALKAHGALNLRDFSRVDFILDEAGDPWCLEANALPGLTANSLLPKAADAAGMGFPEFCHRLAVMALEARGPGRNRGGGVGV